MHLNHYSCFFSSSPRTLGYGDRPYGNSGTVEYNPPTNRPPTGGDELIYVNLNITNEITSSDETTVNSTREGFVILPPNETLLQFITRIECAGMNDTDIRKAASCSCVAEITDQTGQSKQCSCSVCTSGFGPNPISIQCQDDIVAASCSAIDCDSTCNGGCISDCESSGGDCDLCTAPPTASPPPGLADFLPQCALYSTLNEIASCLEKYSDPACFTSGFLEKLQMCLFDEWSGPDPDPSEPIDLQLINETAVCFEPVGDCIVAKVAAAFADIPNCFFESGVALAQCFIDNPTCASPCADRNWTSPFDTVSDADLTSCQNVTSEIMDPMCELVSCCSSCVNELESLAVCAVNESSSLTACDLKCTSSDDRRLDGVTDIVTTASAIVTFSRCISVDFDQENHTVWFDFVDCVIGDILNVYDDFLSTRAPTAAPSTTFPSSMPTAAPSTPAPTSAPSSGAQEYSFAGLTVRLQGAKELTTSSRMAFEEATEEFYKSIFGGGSSARRLLQDDAFTRFDTDVMAQDEMFDANGNTIVYGQSVRFISANGELSEAQTRDLLVAQLAEVENKQEFIALLQEKNTDFQSVTAVDTDPSTSRSSDDDDDIIFGLSLFIIIIAAGGLLVCCCCCCLIIFCVMQKGGGSSNKLNDEGESPARNGDDERVAPSTENFAGFSGNGFGEQVGGDTFADEFANATVPFGGDGGQEESGGSGSGSGSDSDSGSDDDDDDDESGGGSDNGSGSDNSSSEESDRFA